MSTTTNTIANIGYARTRETQYDMAVFTLKKDLGTTHGYLPLATENDDQNSDFHIVIPGYPGDLGSFYPYQANCSSINMMDETVMYNFCDTNHGQSGAAMLTFSETGARILAIHHGASVRSYGKNVGARLTFEKREWIHGIIKDDLFHQDDNHNAIMNLNLKAAGTNPLLMPTFGFQVLGEHPRTLIPNSDMKRDPYRSMGHLRFNDESGDEYFCTATLISRRHIITAGHCAVDSNSFYTNH
eukprot:Pgem_evm1s9486